MTPHPPDDPGAVGVLAWLAASAALLLLTWLASTSSGCATWTVDRPVCGLRRGVDAVSYCCEAGISGELSAGVGSLDVVGLVEGCARWRAVESEGEVRRGR